MKKIVILGAALLTACGNNPPVPDWKLNAHSSLERATSAYLSGKDSIEASEFARARSQIGSTGSVELAIRAELARCATRVASLVLEECPGFEQYVHDASGADIAYAAYLAGRLPASDAARLPEQHRAVAGAASDAAAGAAVLAIADPLSRLVAAGAVFRANRATPEVLAAAVDTASAQGWRRPLLAWLNVQALRADKSGDAAEAARLRRRIALATE
ncbi:hypothetical protein LJR289_002940 [Pseudoduganella sp. LjRoot289]|uniref:hypothetical protein n=1 Tax=Pseudoduganella sp. LjRoot289 TaxID=3342314 RepID=UPI003ECD1141